MQQSNETEQITEQPTTIEENQEDSVDELSKYDVNDLGYHLDGWADLIEGMGEKSQAVHEEVYQSLLERGMPDIEVKQSLGYAKGHDSEPRSYNITNTYPGATTTIYVGQHGKDLYVSWRTYIRPLVNKEAVIFILVISGIIGAVVSNELSDFDVGIFTMVGLISALLLASIIAFAGIIFKGDHLGYFLVPLSVFDADDITGMSLSVHKSLLRALDDTGIDISKLRLKQDFQSGRRGEKV